VNEENIRASGQFSALNAAELPASYQTSDTPRQAGNTAAPAAVAANASASALGVGSTATASQAAPSPQEIQAAVNQANANLSSSNRVVDYRVDAATGLTIATVRNSQTGAVLQQIPGADIIALAKMLAGWSPGKHMLLDLIA
jgi:uncharacterized FlaG/YvyC family protein